MGDGMAIVNYSVPDEVKRAFDRTFAGENRSAIVARLMREAVEEHELTRRRRRIMKALLALRRTARPVSAKEVRRAREQGRP